MTKLGLCMRCRCMFIQRHAGHIYCSGMCRRKDYYRNYYRKNKERIDARAKKWREKNREYWKEKRKGFVNYFVAGVLCPRCNGPIITSMRNTHRKTVKCMHCGYRGIAANMVNVNIPRLAMATMAEVKRA